jgi:exodeoxyribonuclease V alpha subunit
MDELSGSVERVTFYNPETGYSVLRLRPERNLRLPGQNRDGLVTVVGNLPELSPGENLRLKGHWLSHPKHGQQFQVEYCEQTLPATVAGIRRYLGSGLIKGIGPKLADRIVDFFGAKTLEVIENQPERLKEVADIGPHRAALIAAAWDEQRQVKEIMLFLHAHNISTNLAVKIYKQYGDQALAIVQSDPYRLARDIFGIGFKTADRIAQSLGLPQDHPSRIEAGLVYSLNEASEQGNVYAPADALTEQAASLLGVEAEMIPPALARLESQQRIHRDAVPVDQGQPSKTGAVSESAAPYGGSAVYLTPLFYSEVGAAEKLASLAAAFPSRLSDIPPALLALEASLSGEQQQAIRTALGNPVSVLTGGPGTGKTTCIRALIRVLEESHKRYALASPTGRAAKRLSEATGRPASTLHRLLGFSPGEGFKHNAENPLAIDFLVVDETSMLELTLFYNLLKALQPGMHLLLVGDVDQLPSVGPGDVLRDVIRSGVTPVTRLSTIFRQAAGSQIIENAHRINRGEMPEFSKDSQDFYLFPAESADQAAEWVEDVVCRRIPERFGLDPSQDVQVLAPMYRGPAGVTALNERLQAVLNPASPLKAEKKLFGQTFRLGDKVMQVQNNYDKDVYNGDIGIVTGFDPTNHTLTVRFDEQQALYDWSEADQLVLAYAVSVHKAQGSEFPAVVIPLVTAHYLMLQRNLLYTAVTRAKKLCVLVGSRRAIHIAVSNNRVAQRHTALDWRLRRAY